MLANVGGETVPARPKVVAAIPCYNEANYIADVVRRAAAHVDVVVVVDDGSGDDTVEVARAAGAEVRTHGTNRGPGAAARTCLEVGRELGAGVLVTLDGDGQHNPDEIPDVVAPVLEGYADAAADADASATALSSCGAVPSCGADLVIGSRFLGAYNNVARYRKFGIDVITFLYNFGAGNKITDGQSCFRAYSQRALQSLAIAEDGFGFSVETLVQARQAGLRITEASISCIYHEESHSMNPVVHGVGVALMVVKHRVLAALGAHNGNHPSAADPEVQG